MKKTNRSVTPLIFLIGAVFLYVYFIPPGNYVYVGILIFLISLLGKQGVAAFGGDRTVQFLTALFIVIFLTLQSTIGFNVINTILLASFIIGIGIFTRLE